MNRIWRALILGSGLEKALIPIKTLEVETPFGSKVTVYIVSLNDIKALAIPRHGSKHEKPPHMVDYRANLWALRTLGAERILAVNTVGAINVAMKPGDLVVPHDLIDFTKTRTYTFYDSQPVVHIDLTEPYCRELRELLIASTRKLGGRVWERAVYVCTEGPRFETPAEIRMFRLLGGDIVGMTGCPEASLARELGLCYASLCLVSNMAAGLQSRISSEEVVEIASKMANVILRILEDALKNMPRKRSCSCPLQAESRFNLDLVKRV